MDTRPILSSVILLISCASIEYEYLYGSVIGIRSILSLIVQHGVFASVISSKYIYILEIEYIIC